MGRQLVFDVESIGLHGQSFAVGWVVLLDGKEIQAHWVGCPSSEASGTREGRLWVAENIPEDVLLPKPPHRRENPAEVRRSFWEVWQTEKAQGATLWADCLWPVEARFIIACIEDGRGSALRSTYELAETTREWDGPYPFHEIGTLRLAAGKDPLAHEDRMEGEMPLHHPLHDARQSARLLLEAAGRLRGAAGSSWTEWAWPIQ